MLKNYFKIAWRNISANRTYSTINIAGITLGMASFLIIGTLVINEYSYDKQWEMANQIYRIVGNNVQTGERSNYTNNVVGQELENNFPEVLSYTQMSTYKRDFYLESETVIENVVELSTDEKVWEFLDLTVLLGNPQNFVSGFQNVVITKSFKEKHFPNTNPVGTRLVGDLLITGVIEDLPYNTHLRADVLSLREQKPVENPFTRNFISNGTQYVLLKPNVNINTFSDKVNNWYHKQMKGFDVQTNFSFQPISEIYLKSDFANNQLLRGNYNSILILTFVALLLLFIACINFINLSTARALGRIKEAGVRKVLGANRMGLIKQFLTESFLFFVISFVLGIIFYSAALPKLKLFVNKDLTLSFVDNFILFLTIAVFLFFVSLLTGIYPALVLSRPKPTSILANAHRTNKGSEFFRKSLVVVQFIITTAIVVGTIGVYQQLQYINKKDLGYKKENLIKLEDSFFSEKKETFKSAVLQLSGVEFATVAPSGSSSILASSGSMTYSLDGGNIKIDYLHADPDLLSTLKLQLLKGKDVKEYLSTMNRVDVDSLYGQRRNGNTISGYSKNQPVLLTEFTAKRLGIEELNVPNPSIEGIPVGIVKNFHNASLRNPMTPQVIQTRMSIPDGNLFVRLSPGNQKSTILEIEKIFNEFYPNRTFGYSYIEDVLAREYREEARLQQILLSFSVLIVFLSCLGLFGLMTYTIQNRKKELSIRKVLGASIINIWMQLSKGSIGLLTIAVSVAIPLSWYGLSLWLRKFPYHVQLDSWMFILGSTLTILIAFLTITIRILAVAKENPVSNLRSE